MSGRDGSLLSSGSIANNATLSFALYGSQTYSGIINGSGNVLVASGSLTLASGGAITTSAGNLHVGQNAGAMLNVLSNSSGTSRENSM